jgi:hypothetical protein
MKEKNTFQKAEYRDTRKAGGNLVLECLNFVLVLLQLRVEPHLLAVRHAVPSNANDFNTFAVSNLDAR